MKKEPPAPDAGETSVTPDSEHAATLTKGGIWGLVKGSTVQRDKAQQYCILNPYSEGERCGLPSSLCNDTNPIMGPRHHDLI